MTTTDTLSVTDPETLRDREDVPFHEDTDVVDAETVETVAGLDDMAPVGVTNGAGRALVLRVTDTCSWKIPTSAVAPGEEFATAAREWVAANTGLAVDLDGPRAVWHLQVREDGGDRTASRYFVVYGASVDGDPEVPATGAPDPAAEAGWFEALPEGASAVPGTDYFL